MLCARCIGRATITCPPLVKAARFYSAPAGAADLLATPLTPGPDKSTSSSQVSWSSTPAGTKLSNINYFKNKSDPVALEDSEYPEWLWTTLSSNRKATGATVEDVGDLYAKSKKTRALAKKQVAKLAAIEALDPEKKIPIEEQTIDLPFATVTDPKHGPVTRSHVTKVVAAIGVVGEEFATEKSSGGVKFKIRPTTVAVGSEGIEVRAADAAEARQEVKKAMRKKGRASIKEGNFLAQM